ncbi:hypothetical protein [Actinocorallia longicatena]|uniref:MerR family transcriptional regulator n=1 Tax=Actinocorallia longicatena TaxID=111803 RepID=A0ABP6QNM7_9ACTN
MNPDSAATDDEWLIGGYIYSPRAAAESVNVSARILRELARDGLIRHVVVNGHYLLNAYDVTLLMRLTLDHGISARELRPTLTMRAKAGQRQVDVKSEGA